MTEPIALSSTLGQVPAMPTPLLQEDALAGIALSFGDEEEVALSPTPRYSKFEIVSQWKRVLKDFGQVEPLAQAYLDGTTLERGDFQQTPFPLRIFFRSDLQFQHSQFTQNPGYPQALRDYLETILQTRVDLRFELIKEAPGAETMAPNPNLYPHLAFSPAALFEKDQEKEPVLKSLATLFATTWIHTKAAPRKVSSELQDDLEESLDD